MSDAVKIFVSAFGLVAGLPVLVLVVRLSMFFGALKKSVESVEKAADRFTRSTERRLIAIVEDLANHETRLQLQEAGVAFERRVPRKLRSLEVLPDTEPES